MKLYRLFAVVALTGLVLTSCGEEFLTAHTTHQGAAGAEAIAINGQRLTALSEIRCAGPTLSVNNTRSSVPFEIYAIGDKKTLQNAITMRGGVADTLGVWGIKVEVETLDEVYIPPYKGEVPHVYAKVTTQIKN